MKWLCLCLRWVGRLGRGLSVWGTFTCSCPGALKKDTYLVANMHHLKCFKIPRFLFLLHTGTSIHLNILWSIGMSAAVLVYEEWNYTIYFLRQIRFHSGMSPLPDTWNSTWNAKWTSSHIPVFFPQNLHYLPSIWGELQPVKSWSNLWTYLIHTFLPVKQRVKLPRVQEKVRICATCWHQLWVILSYLSSQRFAWSHLSADGIW